MDISSEESQKNTKADDGHGAGHVRPAGCWCQTGMWLAGPWQGLAPRGAPLRARCSFSAERLTEQAPVKGARGLCGRLTGAPPPACHSEVPLYVTDNERDTQAGECVYASRQQCSQNSALFN